MTDLYAGIDYQLFENVAVGLGLNGVNIDVVDESSNLNGDLDWRYDGELLFLNFNFLYSGA